MIRLRLLGVVLLVVGLVFGLAATDVDDWYSLSVVDSSGESVSVYFGLWKFCAKKQGVSSCSAWSYFEQDTTLNDGWLHGCQSLMVFGVAFNTCAFAFAIDKKLSVKAAQLLAFITGGCYAVAAIVFAARCNDVVSTEKHGGALHVGFGLSIVAGLVNFLSIYVLAKAAQTESMPEFQPL